MPATIAPNQSTGAVAAGLSRDRRSKLPWLIGLGVVTLTLLPVALLAGAGNPPCQTSSPGAAGTPAGG